MAFQVMLAVVVVAAVSAAPQYSYEPPALPSTLYEFPAQSVEAPLQEYGPPLVALPQNLVTDVVTAPSLRTTSMAGMPYDFDWGVEDEESGNAFSHVETSDGNTMQGEYRVLLPDGRTQVVKFFDNGGGFNAVVTYEK